MSWVDLGLMHCVKSVRIRRFSGPYFPAFGLNMEKYRVSLLFCPNTGKYGPENSEYVPFPCSDNLKIFLDVTTVISLIFTITFSFIIANIWLWSCSFSTNIYMKKLISQKIFLWTYLSSFCKKIKCLIGINFSAEKIWHKWRKMAKIALFNFFLAAPN